MISYEDALNAVLSKAVVGKEISVSLSDSIKLVLAEDVVSPENIPFADNSAMDGFAVIYKDIKGASKEKPAVLELIGEVPAGKPFSGNVKKGSAVSIYTGAVVPDGADTVVELEVTQVKNGKVYVYDERKPGANIRKAGEDLKAGEVLFQRGTVITPGVAGVLASIGRSRVKVFRPGTVAIISTGSELVEIYEPLKPGAVRNSNTYLLEALLSNFPVKVTNYGIVPDEKEVLRDVLEDAFSSADIILTTGGVSLGDYDLVKVVLEEIGFKQIFWRVAQKPGKPLAFYEKDGKVVFGLPGNPAAVHICFLEYVRPFILKSLGYSNFRPITLKARLKNGHVKKPGRLNFLRVFLYEENGELWVEKAGAQGSGVLSTSARANAVALIPAEVSEVSHGEVVEVHYFEDIGW